MSLQRLSALRALMAGQPTALAAYIVPTADAHNSEYIAAVDARREWLTGFTGSAGTAVVTASKALVWTDGRYYTQFQKEADLTLWTLMKQALPDTPTVEKWLATNLAEGDFVGVDPHTITREGGYGWRTIESALKKANVRLIPVDKNLVDEARVQLNDPPPPRPNNPIIPLPLKYNGKSVSDKIAELRKQMSEKEANVLVLNALDEVAYTLNLRGSDIEYNPVFFSYLVITQSSVILFWGDGNLTQDVVDHLRTEGLEEFKCRPYKDMEQHLIDMAHHSGDGKYSVWLTTDTSESVCRAASGENCAEKPVNLIFEVSPVALMKQIKNAVELEGFRQCHVRDGIAVVRFFKWLHDQLDAGTEVTEIGASHKLLEFRKEEAEFMGPSFETIAGAGENGAVIHYSPSKERSTRVIRKDDMFLLDSGGQYKDGTTDITRTRHMGARPSPEQRDAFTRVLKGQVMVGAALFPQLVKGNVLDSFARHALWNVGLDYAHGTGHGVGHFLNVHEGPSGVSFKPAPNDPGLRPGQILSNEPGYYKVGSFGIRIEDLVEVIAVDKNTDHPKAKNLVGDFDGRGVLGFHTITLVPNQRECIDVKMLDDFELRYVNSYHKRVLDTLGPILKQRGLTEDLLWLEKECAAITGE